MQLSLRNLHIQMLPFLKYSYCQISPTIFNKRKFQMKELFETLVIGKSEMKLFIFIILLTKCLLKLKQRKNNLLFIYFSFNFYFCILLKIRDHPHCRKNTVIPVPTNVKEKNSTPFTKTI